MMPEIKKNIVWLASYPKSGNTWFRIFLSNLFSDSPQPVNINDMAVTSISSNRSILDSYLGMHSSELTAEEINRLRPRVFKKFSDEADASVYIKTHEAWTLNSLGNPIFPEEVTRGVIYMIRNPLDIAISYSFHNNDPIEKTIATLNNDNLILCEEKDRIGIQIQQILGSWSTHVRSWTEESKMPVHVIRFEDMLDDPRSAFRGALEFLELEYGDDEVLNAIHNSSFDRLKLMEAHDGFKERGIHAESFFRKGQSNEWKKVLSEAQVRALLKQHGMTMKKFGYPHIIEADNET